MKAFLLALCATTLLVLGISAGVVATGQYASLSTQTRAQIVSDSGQSLHNPRIIRVDGGGGM